MQPKTSQEIWINGEAQPYAEQTIRELLLTQGVDPDQKGIAIAVNATIVPRNRWQVTSIQPGDRIEIVFATAGG